MHVEEGEEVLRDERPRWAVLGAFAALGAAAGTWGARIPDVRDALDLGEGALGSALLGLSVGAVAGSWFGGLLVRRFGSRRVVARSWPAVGGALLVPAVAPSWLALTTGLLVLGLAIGVLDVSMNGAGVQLEAAADRPLLSGLHAGWSAGVLVGAGLGAVAVLVGLPPSVHLGLVGVAIVALSRPAAPHLPDGRLSREPTGIDHRPAAPTGPGSSGRRLAALAGIGGCVFLADGALLDWSGVLVREDFGGGAVLGVLAFTGVAAGGLAGRLAGDRLSLRWGAGPLIRGGVVLASTAFAAMLLSPWVLPVPFLLILVGAGLAPAVPLAFAAAGHSHGETGIATVTTAGYGCYLAGPAVIGWLADVVGLRGALVVPLLLIVAVLALAWSTDAAPAPVEADPRADGGPAGGDPTGGGRLAVPS